MSHIGTSQCLLYYLYQHMPQSTGLVPISLPPWFYHPLYRPDFGGRGNFISKIFSCANHRSVGFYSSSHDMLILTIIFNDIILAVLHYLPFY